MGVFLPVGLKVGSGRALGVLKGLCVGMGAEPAQPRAQSRRQWELRRGDTVPRSPSRGGGTHNCQ